MNEIKNKNNLININEVKNTDNSIIIVKTNLSSKKENVIKSKSDDKLLISAMDKYVENFKNNNIEIFEQHNNILITEQGYYLSVYAKNINQV